MKERRLAAPDAEFDRAKAKAFTLLMVRHLEGAAVSIMIEVGRRVGLFEAMATMGAATSAEIAAKTGLSERYVREWLAARWSAGHRRVRGRRGTYRLPREHAVGLTGSSTRNFTTMAEMFPLLNRVIPMSPRRSARAAGFRTGLTTDHEPHGPAKPPALRRAAVQHVPRQAGGPHSEARGRHSRRGRGLRHRVLHRPHGQALSEEHVRRLRPRRGASPRPGPRRAAWTTRRSSSRTSPGSRRPRGSISSPRSTRFTTRPIPPA